MSELAYRISNLEKEKKMTSNDFKILHSEIMMYFQCIEYDLKRMYSGMSTAGFDECMDMLETSNFGNVLKKLKKLDNSDGDPYLNEADYELLDQIRDVRNYWSHQCYLDYVYIQSDYDREARFQRLCRRLQNEHNRVYKLHHNLEAFYINNLT